jgi:sodium/potassium/calcium exchanger 6
MGLLFSTIGIAASDFFCINLSTISDILGMSESMAGVTFLAFGNGSPDVFSTFAAMNSHSGSLAVGELIGAAGFITAVVAGSMALVREFKVGKKTFVRDVGFFTVAASFSMIFLADGSLRMWECCVMIGFYLFYVATVVTWHWYLSRRRRRRERDALARGHYVAASNEEIEVSEEYHDDDDVPAGERQSLRERSFDNFEALERGEINNRDEDYESDGDGDEGRHLAAQMADSMRLVRRKGTRRNTANPIRPSLVGALEFRSVLSTLQKSRNIHSSPIHLRRYSDDPTSSANYPQRPLSETPQISDHDSDVLTSIEQDEAGGLTVPSLRARAVSMNDATGAKRQNPAAFTVADVPEIGIVAATPTFPRYLTGPTPGSTSLLPSSPEEYSASPSSIGPASPIISLSPPPSDRGSRDVSPTPPLGRPKYDDRLSPADGIPGARHLRNDFFSGQHGSQLTESPTEWTASGPPRRPQVTIPKPNSSASGRSSSPVLAFPKYTDSPSQMSGHPSSKAPSLRLPDAAVSPESSYVPNEMDDDYPRVVRWWPYRVLPPPEVLLATLFPTLYTWKDKNIWDKFLSVVSAPPIFLLVITLPVVEPANKDDDKDDEIVEEANQLAARRMSSVALRLTPDSPSRDEEDEPEWLQYRRSTLAGERRNTQSPTIFGLSRRSTGGTAATSTEGFQGEIDPHTQAKKLSTRHEAPLEATGDVTLDQPGPSSPRDWNRWLVAVQIFTAPLFVVFILWAGTSEDFDLRYLLRLVLYALLGSLVGFALLLLTTSPDKPPKYRFLLCFMGFVVSISWISTIANEVVGVLKAFGVILGISDAILGLTIFAVGNSLGDLVADITVARLGFPVMALSACFGGPMLNLLLGIGISGLYITVTEANHKHNKHPGRPKTYKPYQIEVSPTLMISGITLLVTLVGLLIVVPLNKWVMSRKIGYGLIILWSISTILNVVVEVTGIFGDIAFVS